MDNIIGRINRILGKSYDPVRVKLQAPQTNKKTTKRKKSNKRKTNNNKKREEVIINKSNKMGEIQISRAIESEAREPAYVLISKNGSTDNAKIESNSTAVPELRASGKSKKNKTKSKQSKKSAKARATLFGLSSIKRDGDVTVSVMSDHTTVKSNFILGPLTLRVEKEASNKSIAKYFVITFFLALTVRKIR